MRDKTVTLLLRIAEIIANIFVLTINTIIMKEAKKNDQSEEKRTL
jgi:hypothetical protein